MSKTQTGSKSLARRLTYLESAETERLVLRAIGRCNGIATSSDIKSEAYRLSESQTGRALTRLVEKGTLQRTQHPDDGRKTVYELAHDITQSEVTK